MRGFSRRSHADTKYWLLFLKIELGIYALIRWDLGAFPPRPHDTHQSAVQGDVMDTSEFNENIHRQAGLGLRVGFDLLGEAFTVINTSKSRKSRMVTPWHENFAAVNIT